MLNNGAQNVCWLQPAEGCSLDGRMWLVNSGFHPALKWKAPVECQHHISPVICGSGTEKVELWNLGQKKTKHALVWHLHNLSPLNLSIF